MKVLKALLIFVTVTSLGALVFLSYDSVIQMEARSPDMTRDVIQGKQVWQQYNCINCHTILGNGAYYAPDLTKVAERRTEKWLTEFLVAPQKIWPETSMKNIRLTRDEAESLVIFLTWVKGIDTNDWPPQPLGQGNSPRNQSQQNNPAPAVSEGMKAFETQSCPACHAINGIGGHIGPDLTTIGQKYDRAQLTRFLRNPQELNPKTRMGNPNLSEKDLKSIVEYLSTLK